VRAHWAIFGCGLVLVTAGLSWVGPVRAETLDPRQLVLSLGELPTGFVLDEDGSGESGAPDGTARAYRMYRRSGPDGERLVRSTVVVAPDTESARASFARLPGVMTTQGFTPIVGPKVGDQSVAFTALDDFDGANLVYWSLIFQRDRVLATTEIGSPAGSLTIDDAGALAKRVSAKIGPALAGQVMPVTSAPGSQSGPAERSGPLQPSGVQASPSEPTLRSLPTP
jgi:hypothetical protein